MAPVQMETSGKGIVWRRIDSIQSSLEQNESAIHSVASCLGIGTGTARILLKELKASDSSPISTLNAIRSLVGGKLESTARKNQNTEGELQRDVYIQFSHKYPTLVQWLDENSSRVAIVRSGNHYAYVGFGLVIEAAGWMDYGRDRVTHVVFVDTEN